MILPHVSEPSAEFLCLHKTGRTHSPCLLIANDLEGHICVCQVNGHSGDSFLASFLSRVCAGEVSFCALPLFVGNSSQVAFFFSSMMPWLVIWQWFGQRSTEIVKLVVARLTFHKVIMHSCFLQQSCPLSLNHPRSFLCKFLLDARGRGKSTTLHTLTFKSKCCHWLIWHCFGFLGNTTKLAGSDRTGLSFWYSRPDHWFWDQPQWWLWLEWFPEGSDAAKWVTFWFGGR